jgi:hypothetical protein
VGPFTIGVPKKRKKNVGFLWGYFLQITIFETKLSEKN